MDKKINRWFDRFCAGRQRGRDTSIHPLGREIWNELIGSAAATRRGPADFISTLIGWRLDGTDECHSAVSPRRPSPTLSPTKCAPKADDYDGKTCITNQSAQISVGRFNAKAFDFHLSLSLFFSTRRPPDREGFVRRSLSINIQIRKWEADRPDFFFVATREETSEKIPILPFASGFDWRILIGRSSSFPYGAFDYHRSYQKPSIILYGHETTSFDCFFL